MCVRLGNKRHCLTILSLTGLLQLLVAVPIIVISFIVFAQTDLGGALSPFWAGFLVIIGEKELENVYSFLHKLINSSRI